ncbi:DNA methyltransferase [Vagococcus hydrophili]|uniref:DNA methyltransferase n=1 Tax=Vagococcus hydrophili TaxID=2714947 RepID=UPI003B839363
MITQIAHKARASVSNDKIISQNHNFILLYAKNIDVVFNKRSEVGLDPVLEGFSNPDADSRGDWKGTPVDGPGGAKKGNPYYEFMGVEGYFRYSKETMQKLYDDGLIVRTKNGLQRKYFLTDAIKSRKTDTSWWENGGYTTNATRELNGLMGEKTFDTPKPVELIERMLKLFTNNDKKAIVLDFFSGSGTVAEAVMKINKEDAGFRKYILVQLPEVIAEKTDAFNAGYRKIPEIAEERIRRAGDKIIDKNPDLTGELDIGFKVFELERSNLKKWNSDPEDLVTMFDSIQDNLEAGSTEDDLVFEIMLKQGLELTLPIEKIIVGDANIYKIAYGSLFIVLGKNITSNASKKIVEFIKNEALEDVAIVLQDTGFISDSEKLNSIEILNTGGVDYNDILSI